MPSSNTDDTSAPRQTKVEIFEVGVEQAGQRIDNFLIKYLKGVPKTRLYRALRGGEVRVNGARKKAPYQLCVGDRLRIPPIRRSESAALRAKHTVIPESLLEKIPFLFEDAHLAVVDKPSGLAVHGGTAMDYGLIEALRKLRPELPYIELVHRLDRETSGCLMLAKSRSALLALQTQLGTERSIDKDYVALLKGAWHGQAREVDIPLTRQRGSKKMPLEHGEGGLEAHSIFTPKRLLANCTLMNIRLLTGRMHQARVHAAAIHHPIAGDWLHGEQEFNRMTKKAGLTRLFLHAAHLRFTHPIYGTPLEVHSPLPACLEKVLDNMDKG